MFFKRSVGDLDTLFNPRSVAVIGASADESKLGYILIDNLLKGARRKIYPINPKESKIAGLLCYASVLQVPKQIDVAIIAVPASIVLTVLEECGRKGIKYVIVISAGFKELGHSGAELESQLVSIADKYQIKLLGPNCLGLLDANTNLNASFVGETPLKGSIAFLSQSGAVCSSILDWSLRENIGFSKFVSLGNEAGLTENDFLDYLADDSDTRAILMYIEAVSDGVRFVKTLKRITAHKPVVILKAGRSARGSQAVSSHTGSLASGEAIIKSACLQGGAIYVTDLRMLFNIAKLFNAGYYQSFSRLCILTNGGGPSIVMSDLIDLSDHLNLITLKADTQARLRSVLPVAAAVANPVDLIGDAHAQRYQDALDILTKVKDIDAIITILTPQKMTEPEATAKVLIKYSKLKPILPMFIGESSTRAAEAMLKRAKLGNFEFPGDLQEILEAMSTSAKDLTKPGKLVTANKNQRQLDAEESFVMLSRFGLIASGLVLRQSAELDSVLGQLTAPLAMKVISADVIHKSDCGAVALHLHTVSDLHQAWDSILANVYNRYPRAKVDGMLVQPMSRGKEVIIGMKRDASFGPVIMFGMGGVMVEVFKDVAMRVAPVDRREALAMINELKSSVILKGYRGEAPVNLSILADIIIKISKLSLAHPEIKELDLNPVLINEAEAHIVDVRIIV